MRYNTLQYSYLLSQRLTTPLPPWETYIIKKSVITMTLKGWSNRSQKKIKNFRILLIRRLGTKLKTQN